MAKALRSNLTDSASWAPLVRLARNRKDAFHPEKCPNCDVEYTVLLGVMEDAEAAVKLLREHLSKECPEHQTECYNIDSFLGRISPGD